MFWDIQRGGPWGGSGGGGGQGRRAYVLTHRIGALGHVHRGVVARLRPLSRGAQGDCRGHHGRARARRSEPRPAVGALRRRGGRHPAQGYRGPGVPVRG